MPQGICSQCNRLIYDTEKLDELPDRLECQHCHTVNVIREKVVEPVLEVEPEPEAEPVVVGPRPIVKPKPIVRLKPKRI